MMRFEVGTKVVNDMPGAIMNVVDPKSSIVPVALDEIVKREDSMIIVIGSFSVAEHLELSLIDFLCVIHI